MKSVAPLVLLVVFAPFLHAQSSADTAVTSVVQKFVRAQADFDLPTISALAATNYVEISPLGEVDPRDKMLSYYTPDKKVAAPPLSISETEVRTFGDSASEIAKITWDIPGHSMQLRAVFTVHHEPSGWKLVSAQYTPIHEKPAAK